MKYRKKHFNVASDSKKDYLDNRDKFGNKDIRQMNIGNADDYTKKQFTNMHIGNKKI